MSRSTSTSSQPLTRNTPSYASVIDQVRKWNVKWDGERDPLDFIERIEELACTYEFPVDFLPRAMPELLRGPGLAWYRNNNQHWTRWDDFREDCLSFFLPAQFWEDLEDEIRQRKQKPLEKFKTYLITLQALMRTAGYDETRKLERIYRNTVKEVQLYVRRRDFHTLKELTSLVEDWERLQENMGPQKSTMVKTERHRQVTVTPGPIPNPSMACRKCGLQGHYANSCNRPRILFCWQCGKRDVRTLDCCNRRSGNAEGSRQTRGMAVPQSPSPQ